MKKPRPNFISNDEPPSRISTKPVPVTKVPIAMLPSMRTRKPGATVELPRVWFRPVVLSCSRVVTLAPKPRPTDPTSMPTLTRATSPLASMRKPLSLICRVPIGARSSSPLTISSMPGVAPPRDRVNSTWPRIVSRSPITRSPAISRWKPLCTLMVWLTTLRLPAESRSNPSKTTRSSAVSAVPRSRVRDLTANVEMVRSSENVLISRRNCPLSEMPGIPLAARVSWMRPTTPVYAGAPTYTARLMTLVIEPSSGTVPPSAPSILK